MKVLVADDDPVSLDVVASNLELFGHEPITASGGRLALEQLQGPDGPKLAILDWMMPDMTGVEVCRHVRSLQVREPPYLVILTSLDSPDDVLAALDAGADEFLAKPVAPLELRARVDVGRRMITLRSALAEQVRKLEHALEHVKTLRGILPICSYCKKIRDDQEYWVQVEQYLSEHVDVLFSRGVCPDCYARRVSPQLERLEDED